jgi:MoaA/NifB/PqqE/SkfB family radical SAM enzyme
MNHGPDHKRKLRLLFWESTIKCNLSCAHCRRVEDDDTVDADMSTAQAKDLIDQLAELGRLGGIRILCRFWCLAGESRYVAKTFLS